MNDPKTVLRTDHLTIGYKPARRPAFTVAQNINAALYPGELVCLLGPNGGGKSTLIRTIAGMQRPLAGTVSLLGDALHKLAPNALARRLSVVLTDRPDVGLLSGYGLVALGRHPYTDWTGRLAPEDQIIVREAVEAVGASDIAHRPVIELSDGQRQKILIARALAQEPVLMILDEPTAFLDLPRRVEIMKLLKTLTRTTGRTILLSTHDLDLALRTADRLWLLADGTLHSGVPEDLVLDGTFETVFRSAGASFDLASGAFRVENGNGAITLSPGETVYHIWTRRALEREGYAVDMTPTLNPPDVTVQITEDGVSWQIKHTHTTINCHSLDELTHHLRENHPAASPMPSL